ncbi:hypothetical protein ES708_18798 [subsurface metagenome]
MPSEEFERLKEALRKAPTPEARKEAAEAMKRYLKGQAKGGSRPTLVSLGLRKTYPHAIPLEQIPDELERNPEFFELIKRAVTKEK